MTTLVSWVGVDSRSPSSVYLASDSRITWPDGQQWDVGTKLFSSSNRPEIFGYCGDVVFPTQLLPKLCEQIDRLEIFGSSSSFEVKLQWVSDKIRDSISEYPNSWKAPFKIIYMSRSGEGGSATFHAAIVSLAADGSLTTSPLMIPSESGLIEKAGSGAGSIHDWYSRWQKSDVARTSRAVFGAFCDSLGSCADSNSGGSPQLIGLYLKGPARKFGVIWKGEKYYLGVKQSPSENMCDVEWRNTNFERCDPDTMEVMEHAQKQPRPRILERC